METITAADVATIFGLLIGSWGLGWCAGHVQVLFIKASEKL